MGIPDVNFSVPDAELLDSEEYVFVTSCILSSGSTVDRDLGLDDMVGGSMMQLEVIGKFEKERVPNFHIDEAIVHGKPPTIRTFVCLLKHYGDLSRKAAQENAEP